MRMTTRNATRLVHEVDWNEIYEDPDRRDVALADVAALGVDVNETSADGVRVVERAGRRFLSTRRYRGDDVRRGRLTYDRVTIPLPRRRLAAWLR